jgi:hypothetical protein
MEGALAGFSGAAIGLIVAMSVKVLGTVRAARLWPLSMAIAFVGYGLLGFGLSPVLATAFTCSLIANWPKGGKRDGRR